jgi:hypothetical protein
MHEEDGTKKKIALDAAKKDSIVVYELLTIQHRTGLIIHRNSNRSRI